MPAEAVMATAMEVAWAAEAWAEETRVAAMATVMEVAWLAARGGWWAARRNLAASAVAARAEEATG